jgi:hypothetical protein
MGYNPDVGAGAVLNLFSAIASAAEEATCEPTDNVIARLFAGWKADPDGRSWGHYYPNWSDEQVLSLLLAARREWRGK